MGAVDNFPKIAPIPSKDGIIKKNRAFGVNPAPLEDFSESVSRKIDRKKESISNLVLWGELKNKSSSKGAGKGRENRATTMKGLHKIAFVLLIIGGLNWLLLGVFSWDIGEIFGGQGEIISRIIYILVGISALVEMFGHKGTCKECSAPSSAMPKA